MPIHSHERCVQMYRTLKLGYEQICVGGVVGKDSCGGDSGGYSNRLIHDPMNLNVSNGCYSIAGGPLMMVGRSLIQNLRQITTDCILLRL